MAGLTHHLERMFTRPVDASDGGPGHVVAVGVTEERDAEPVAVGEVMPGKLGSTRVEVVVGGWRFEFEVEPEERARLRDRAMRAADLATGASVAEVRAMIPGRVVSVGVAAGDIVTSGQPLLVVEAMKMQNEVRAPAAGTVARVLVGTGDGVELGDPLVVLEPASNSAGPPTSADASVDRA